MTELNDFFSDFKEVCAKCNSMICSCKEENPIDKWINKFYCGDSFELANQLPDESIDSIITSPPYFQLRTYSENNSNEIGREDDPYEYINKLVKLFNILKRKLKKTGTLWCNIGDVYAGGCGGPTSWERTSEGIEWYEKSKKNPHRKDKMIYKWMKPKQLLLIPSRFAIEMQNSGFWLRNDIIWTKPNSAPMSIRDRFKNSFEHIFLFTKSKTYFFNIDEIRVPHKTSLKSLQNRIDYDTERRGGKLQEGKIGTGQWSIHQREINPLGTVPQDSWKYNEDKNEPNNFKSLKQRMAYARRVEGKEHDSAINHPLGKSPEDFIKYETGYEGGKKLRKPPNSGPNAFHKLGKTPNDIFTNFPKNPESRIRLDTLSAEEKMHPLGSSPNDVFEINTQPSLIPHYAQFPEKLIESPMIAGTPKELCIKCGTPKERIFITRLNNFIIKQCKCHAGFRKGIVLDCFMGAGTVAIVAEKLGFDWIGFELVGKNIEYSYQRLNDYRQSLKYSDIEDFKEIQKLKRDAIKTKPLSEYYEQ